METLRIAFLSALVMELVAAVSVALVAVPVGLRLVDGSMDLRTAFFVLLLVPEVYLPLRATGTQWHAAAEGLAVVDDVFALTDETTLPRTAKDMARPSTPATSRPQADRFPQPRAPRLDTPRVGANRVKSREEVGGPGKIEDGRFACAAAPLGEIRFDGATVHYEAGAAPALRDFSATLAPGESVALVGPSGAGKTTVLNLLLGFAPLTAGRLTCGGADLAADDAEQWLRRVAWVPQRPHLFAMSVADNIRLGQPEAAMDDVREAAESAGVVDFADRLPDGFDTRLGEKGFGLSTGQRRRVALARAFLRLRVHDCPLVLLDEPTASLDAHSEAAVAEATALLLRGRTSLVVAHRPALLDHADRVWRLQDGRLSPARDMREANEVGHA
ncbi:MAG: ABC transporter ATP-binding protein/permease, partial [Stackebrandtia sp.]